MWRIEKKEMDLMMIVERLRMDSGCLVSNNESDN